MQEAPLNDLDTLDSNLQIETLKNALVNELADLSREMESPSSLLEELRKKYPAEDFWDEMEKYLGSLLRPYQETRFLRDMEASALERYLLETFENMIRYQEPWDYLSEHLSVDEKQLQVTYRVQNTLIQWVIEDRYSRRNFQQECKRFFLWPDTLSDVLWKLLDDNRAMLVERALLKISREINKSLDKTSSFLDGFDDDFDSDDDMDNEFDEDNLSDDED